MNIADTYLSISHKFSGPNRQLVAIAFRDTPSTKSNIVLESGIILLGAGHVKNQDAKGAAADRRQKTIKGEPIVTDPDAFYIINMFTDRKGKPTRFKNPFKAGDIIEAKANEFERAVAGRRVFKCDDGYLALLFFGRLACIHRHGKVLPIGPSVILEPLPAILRPWLIDPKQPKYQRGKGLILTKGEDKSGRMAGFRSGDVAMFTSEPYEIHANGKTYWEMLDILIWGKAK